MDQPTTNTTTATATDTINNTNKRDIFLRYFFVIFIGVLLIALSFGAIFYYYNSFKKSQEVSNAQAVGTSTEAVLATSTITTYGVAKRDVVSNKIRWEMYNEYDVDYPEDYDHGYEISSSTLKKLMDNKNASIESDKDNIKKILIENGLPENIINISKTDVSGFDFPPFVFSYTITVESDNVDLVEKVANKISMLNDFKGDHVKNTKKYYYVLDEKTKSDLNAEAADKARSKADSMADIKNEEVVKIEEVLPTVINIVPTKNTNAISVFEKDSQHYYQEDDNTSKYKTVLVDVPIIFQTKLKYVAEKNKDLLSNTKEISYVPVSPDDHVRGPDDAPVTIIHYGDISCPPCKDFFDTMELLVAQYGYDGQIRWVYRSLNTHDSSSFEAQGLECAANIGGNEKFWNFLNGAYSKASSNRGLRDVNSTVDNLLEGLSLEQLNDIAIDVGVNSKKFNRCLTDGVFKIKVQTESDLGAENGITGTPISVVILNKPLNDKAFEAISAFNTYDYKYNLRNIVVVSPDRKRLLIDGAINYTGMSCIFNAIFGREEHNVCR